MGLTAHRAIEAGNIHPPFQFVFADAAERAAVETEDLEATDLYSLAMQESNHSIWCLISLDPVTWVQLTTS